MESAANNWLINVTVHSRQLLHSLLHVSQLQIHILLLFLSPLYNTINPQQCLISYVKKILLLVSYLDEQTNSETDTGEQALLNSFFTEPCIRLSSRRSLS